MRMIIDTSSMIPIYEQLMDSVKAMIMSGELKEGDPLPSIRTLSAELKISALTVKKAYDQLEQEGFTATVHGKGSYVKGGNPEMIREMQRMEIERSMEEVVKQAKEYRFSNDEIREVLELYLED